MNTTDKIINELAIKVANLTVENVNYKVLYNEALEDNDRLKQSLERINSVLENDKDLKELFDEIADKLEKED
jgi:hypothetical protein|nr:MAG TPA: Protein phosphatase 1 regulatory subunit KINSASE G - I [Caudoviricetes sp.]DAY38938.1 MAG TPA: Protein phosphatase 1 regulatory subunit KINSASE G - I [Caudoviricetes sp.]